MRATSTVFGLVVRGTAIESVARHYCKSFGIPVGKGEPLSVGRVKYIPKTGYKRVAQGRGSFIAVVLPVAKLECECTEEEIAKGCTVHDHIQYK